MDDNLLLCSLFVKWVLITLFKELLKKVFPLGNFPRSKQQYNENSFCLKYADFTLLFNITLIVTYKYFLLKETWVCDTYATSTSYKS